MRTAQKSWFIRSAAATVVLLGLLFWTSQHRQFSIDSGTRTHMGTLVRIVVVVSQKDKAGPAIENAFDWIEVIEKLMSDRDPNSQLSYVNRTAFFEPVRVDDLLFEVLAASKEYGRLSDGAFDVTVGPLVKLYRQAGITGVAPSAEALASAKEVVGWQNLLLDPEKKTVRFAKEGMMVDLGGIAKGYAVDKAIESLRESGVLGAMVDIGGNLRCLGTPAHKAPHWKIGLQDPRDEEAILAVLNMDNMAVATSGDYRRYVTIGGQHFSHILDPATGRSSQTLSSVTIIGPTAMQTDALSTAVTVLQEQKGLQLISTFKNTEAILVKNGQLLKSQDADRFIIESYNKH